MIPVSADPNLMLYRREMPEILVRERKMGRALETSRPGMSARAAM
jgi:hypothetical protein